jgi:RHS repeat-associated protein
VIPAKGSRWRKARALALLASLTLPVVSQAALLAVDLLDPTGKPVVRYAYSPSGDVTRTTIDPNAPRPTQLRIEGRTGIVVQFSEEISRDELEAALAASGIQVTRPANRNKAEIPLTLAPVLERGPKARREWVLTLGEEPAAGEQLELLLDKASVMDGFLNHPEEDLRFAITWPTTSATSRHILEDTDPPRVDLLVVWDNHLEIELSEAPNEATLGAVRLNGQPLAVTLQADGFTLRSDQPLPLGDHLLEIETSLKDRGGRPLQQRFDAAFTWDGTTDALAIFKAESDTTPTNLLRRSRADKDLVADLTGLNLGFQGQPYDPETGLYYFRNRYYDPELGRFITADPLGYVDGPSLYAFAGNDPVNGRDPLGLQMGGPPMAYSAQQYVVSGQAAADVASSGRQDASLVAGFVPGVGEAHDASQALTGIDPITGEVLSNGQRVIAGAAVVAPVAGRRFFEGALDWLGKRGEDLAGWFGCPASVGNGQLGS